MDEIENAIGEVEQHHRNELISLMAEIYEKQERIKEVKSILATIEHLKSKQPEKESIGVPIVEGEENVSD